MAVPENLIGVWQRESIQIDDGEAYEDSRVLWLQTRSRYADMRVPFQTGKVSQEAFAGDGFWSEPVLTFKHELDFTGTASEDAGTLSWDDETLVEAGSVELPAGVINYVERWRRCTPANVTCETWEVRNDDALQAIALRVGDYAILMSNLSEFGARLFERDSSVWQQTTSIGAKIEDHPPWDLAETIGDAALNWKKVD